MATTKPPIHHDCKQNTPEWLKLRAGLPTASMFSKIVTPGGKLSTSSDEYMYKLLAERRVGHVLEFESEWMERGREFEGEAVKAYEFMKDVDTKPSGFYTNAEGTYGCSLDREIGEDGILEIKCPSPGVHVSYMLKKPVDSKYYPQIQGQLLVTQRKWVDIVSYYPELPIAIVRVERNEEFIATLQLALDAFARKIEENWKVVQALE